MEKQLSELLHQQQLKMKGQLKELPQEELQEQADDVSEQHEGTQKPSGGRLTEYPQCSLEVLSRDAYRQSTENSVGECTGEMQYWLTELPVKLYCLVRVQTRREKRTFKFETEEIMQHVLERRQPEHVLERRQPEHVQERRQPAHLQERRQPEHDLERRQPEHVLERRQPEHVQKRRQPEHDLERRQPEHLQERRQC